MRQWNSTVVLIVLLLSTSLSGLQLQGLAMHKVEDSDHVKGQGLHLVWLLDIPDTSVAEYLPTSSDFEVGRISPQYEEWKALFFDVLHAGTDPIVGYRMRGSTVVPFLAAPFEFTDDIAGYPMLSKIKGRIYDATYTRAEVRQLREECLRIKESCTNEKALAALDKLISICDMAIQQNACVILQGD